ncbi:MAG: hypothetical protein K8T10_16690 [Candidatus Eremiobacteraeota bacterium]|nr:hypothetical protein [Candidatus Eremiobacteraeota bacterium]
MNQKIPRWVSTILWVVGIFSTAFLLGNVISLYFKGKWTVPQKMVLAREEVKQEKMKKPFKDYRDDIQPMFGEVKKASPKKKKPEGENPDEPEDPVNQVSWDQLIPTAQEQMRLNGTMIGSDTAIAIINVEGKDLSLQIGQQVGSYTVDSILKNAVVFKKDSKEIMLAMNLSENAPVRAASNIRRMPARTLKKPKKDNLDDIVKASGSKRIVDRRKFNALLTPPSKLAKDLKFIPNSKDDKPYGMKISYLKNNSFFTKLGLKAGDILVKANNKEIKSVEDSFETYQMFRNEDHMTLEVDRNGQIVKIPIEFR